MMHSIPFNRPFLTGRELEYLNEVCVSGRLAGDGPFTRQVHAWIESRCSTPRALLTHSCTAALEMAALLLDIVPGDEVIMPSYTFVSTAAAFALRGAVPVFVDIRADTLNIDETLIEEAITSRTRAIVPVHYAGVSCEMDSIMSIARRHGLRVIEDAAQGVMASYRGRPLGSMGDLGAISFHETKNIVAGEGGALLVNDDALGPRAEMIREKGTDRSRFLRGEVDRYTWQEVGSSYLPSELVAALLVAQLERADAITQARMAIWNAYHEAFERTEADGRLRRPIVPDNCQHNAHMYYLILPPGRNREAVVGALRGAGVQPVSHYVPLHSSPAGMRHGRAGGDLSRTEILAQRVLRLPLWPGMQDHDVNRVIEAVTVRV